MVIETYTGFFKISSTIGLRVCSTSAVLIHKIFASAGESPCIWA